jgi:hypothetical protein
LGRALGCLRTPATAPTCGRESFADCSRRRRLPVRIVFFSNRNVTGDLYEFLDKDVKRVQMLGIADFKVQLDAQMASGAAARVASRAP